MQIGLTPLSYPRSTDEEIKTDHVWLKGHTGKLSDILSASWLTLYRHRFSNHLVVTARRRLADIVVRRELEMG